MRIGAGRRCHAIDVYANVARSKCWAYEDRIAYCGPMGGSLVHAA